MNGVRAVQKQSNEALTVINSSWTGKKPQTEQEIAYHIKKQLESEKVLEPPVHGAHT